MSIRFNPSYLIELPSGSQTRVTLHDSGVTIDAVSLKSVGESSVAASLLIVCTATAAALPLRAVDWPMVGSDLREMLSARKRIRRPFGEFKPTLSGRLPIPARK